MRDSDSPPDCSQRRRRSSRSSDSRRVATERCRSGDLARLRSMRAIHRACYSSASRHELARRSDGHPPGTRLRRGRVPSRFGYSIGTWAPAKRTRCSHIPGTGRASRFSNRFGRWLQYSRIPDGSCQRTSEALASASLDCNCHRELNPRADNRVLFDYAVAHTHRIPRVQSGQTVRERRRDALRFQLPAGIRISSPTRVGSMCRARGDHPEVLPDSARSCR